MLKNSLKNLPETPGVYIFLKESKPIYIGKAINLKRRVSSYFDLDLNIKTAKMVSEATNLEYIQVNSEIEALLLEAKMVRKFMPHFNIQLKDDKHPLYIIITKEEFPRVLAVRKLISNSYFKEASTSYSLISSYGPFPSSTAVKSVLRMIRKIFPYSDHKVGKRPCLYSHIRLCEPCPSEITRIKNDELRMENKKIYKKNIKRIKSILSGKFDGVKKELQKEMALLSNQEKYEDAIKVRAQIEKLDYITRSQTKVDSYLENPNLYEDQRKIELDRLKNILVDYKLQINGSLHRIECFDIAHLSGTNATASMITFVDGVADKSYYRHFKIKQHKRRSDYDSMKEVAQRRAKHFEDWGVPDLIIVDGGVTEVRAFILTLAKSSVKIPVIGISKNPDKLVLENNTKIKLTSEILNLVQRIRDEAHRFARRYHHGLILKQIRANEKNT